jgi:CubicO group peptidase (beta-lactamase class C family)
MKALLLFTGLLLGAATPSAAQTTSSTTALEQAIAAAIQRRYQPITDVGIAVAVLQDRKLLYAGGFGLRDRGSAEKVEPATMFAVGSATKAFTSMALSMLAEQGTIRLDVPVNRYLRDFAMQDADAQAEMTLEDILSHRTGLPRHDALWYLTPFTRAQLYHRLRYLDPNTKPGTGFRRSWEYNSMTYSVAAFALEAVTGQSWEGFVKARILNPLGMAKTNFTIKAFQAEPNHAKGYFRKMLSPQPPMMIEMPLKDFDNIAPAAAINSNVLEMAEWVRLHLSHGVTADGTRLIDRASLEKMYVGYVAIPSGGQSGLGWAVESLQGKRLVSHTGIPDGYFAYVSFMPDDGLGLVVLTNQNHDFVPPGLPVLLAGDIYAYLLQASSDATRSVAAAAAALPAQTEQSGADQQVAAAQPSDAASAEPAAPVRGYTGLPSDYAGLFSHPGYGDISITVRGGTPYMSYYQAPWPLQKVTVGTVQGVPDLFAVPFHAFGYDRFVPVTFNRNAIGEVDKLTFPLEKEVKPIQFIKR